MKIDWANDSVQIGRQWQRWGAHFPFGGYLLAFSGLGPSLKGQRNEAIVWDHTFAKDWGFYLGVYHNSNNDFGSRAQDDFSQSPYPFIEGGLKYTSESCGRIGNQIMMFDIGGFLGWERKIVDLDPAVDVSRLDDDLNQAWGVALKYYVPIIPERKGNKAGALGIGGNAFIGQNLGWYGGVGSYPRPTNTPSNQSLSYPHSWGGWFQLDYWFTNALSFHGWYSHAQNKYSGRFLDPNFVDNQNVMKKNQQYIFNVSYDVNPAMRFGVEYAHIRTNYGNYGYANSAAAGAPPVYYVNGDKKGTLNTVRIGAWYFF
jgi:hypothetical protein